MITIVDYGMGNLGSMMNMFKRIGFPCTIESNPNQIINASKLILPGVGAFDTAVNRINNVPGLRDALNHKALNEKVPVLGVCLGMQLLTDKSEEGTLGGLGWIPGFARKFKAEGGIKVPHMGWNTATLNNYSSLTSNIPEKTRYYFVHSYYITVNEPSHSLMRSHHGITFDSAIGKDNIFGVQFHPEKSHKFGMNLLSNFAKI